MSALDDEKSAASAAVDGRTYAVRVALFYGALFLIYGVHLPFLPVWLDWRGLSPNEIAAIISGPFFLRLVVTPAVALAADRFDSHRLIVISLGWTCLVTAVLLANSTAFVPIFLAAVAFHLAASTIMPLTETVAVRGVKAANLDYGRMRLWGSLTFILAGLAGGSLMDEFGPAAAVWLMAAGALATAIAAHGLPRSVSEAKTRERHSSRLAAAAAKRLVRTPVFIVFLLAVGLIQATHGTFYAFGAVHWRSQGISTVWVGLLWAVAVLAEVALFAWSRPVLARFGPLALIASGGAAAILRWGAMCLDPPLWALFPLQLLHALTYGASHLGAIHFIGKAVPEEAAGTAQALYATFAAGVFMGVVTLASGPIYSAYHGLSFIVPAVLAVAGFVLAMWLYRRWDGRPLW